MQQETMTRLSEPHSSLFFGDSVRELLSFRSCEFPESWECSGLVNSFYLTEQSLKSCCRVKNTDLQAELVESREYSFQIGFVGQSRAGITD